MLKMRNPAAVCIGFVYSPIFNFTIFFKISLFIELSFIQPILPPVFELSDTLNNDAVF